MQGVQTGLSSMANNANLQSKIKGNIGLLCHSASIDESYTLAANIFQKIFGKRLIKLFGPQHGLVTDVQDNMIETEDFIHPYFKLPVYSLYSKTRVPTDEMLAGIDTFVVDLQDIGTRIYTYIYTLTLAMEACAKKGIKVVVLDRPNPINGKKVEGNILDPKWSSFVGRHPLPVRHGMTMGEIAKLAINEYGIDCELEVIEMNNWKRSMAFEETGLPWVMPSPNIPIPESCWSFVGTVLFEGTNISEGRGTTRPLEMIAHPDIEPFAFADQMQKVVKDLNLEGQILRPLIACPTFQKHAGIACGGLQIHITDRDKFRPWHLGQVLCQKLYELLGDKFQWKLPPYEYEYEKLPVDLINGTDQLRSWASQGGDFNQLLEIESKGRDNFLNQRNKALIY